MNLLQSNLSCEQKFCMNLFEILNSKKKFFSIEMNIYTTNVKTTVTWYRDYYGCQGYKKK